MALTLHIDGGARGNPGPAGAGVVITNDAGESLHEAGYFLGRQTNNGAEYQALILGLRRALRLHDGAITIYSDSELLVKQVTGEYRVKNPQLAELMSEAQSLLLKFNEWTVRHVRREKNRDADRLANLAMDRARDAIMLDADGETKRDGGANPNGPGQVVVESGPADDDDSGAPSKARKCAVRTEPPGHAIRVVPATAPDSGVCPAAVLMRQEFLLGVALPAGMCLHAAHALLPTVLAMNNTDPKEFAKLPTVTVRCMRPGCGAAFHLSPLRSQNGSTARSQ